MGEFGLGKLELVAVYGLRKRTGLLKKGRRGGGGGEQRAFGKLKGEKEEKNLCALNQQ